MPHRRRPQKGSFGGHFDDLVSHFPIDECKNDRSKDHPAGQSEDRSVHDRLFERAWSKQKDERPS